MEKVVVAELSDKPLVQEIEDIFAAFGGILAALPTKEQVFIKPNAGHFAPYACTSPQVLAALLSYLRDHGYDRLRVMDSSRQGLFTRLVFRALEYDTICRRFGAKPVYLDERETVPIALDGESEPVEIPRVVYEELIVRQGQNIYLSLPKLKTHSMTTVSLNIKGQQAFVKGTHRSRNHNYRLHHHLTGLYRLIQPDFSLIDGTQALVNGHCPPNTLQEQSVINTNVLIGGQDALAVDVVGSRVLGYETSEITHLRLATEMELGTGQLEDIQIIGDLSHFTKQYPHQIPGYLPDDIDIVEGKTRACQEGCEGSTKWIVAVLHSDYGGTGNFSIVYGKGIDLAALQDLRGDILVVGPCAVAETEALLHQLYQDRHIYLIHEHINLGRLTAYLSKMMGIERPRLIPLSRLQTIWLSGQARLNRLTAKSTFPG